MSSANNTENTVAFAGIEGAYSDLACRQAQPYMTPVPMESFDDVFEAVEQGRVTYGMIPIENSQAGRVAEIHNILPKTKLHIVSEYFLKVEHHLFAPKGTELEKVTDVYSHPQALMQCRDSLRELGLNVHAYADTAMAAKDVAEWNDPTKAAVCSELAGALYGLECVKENMQDDENNQTLFLTFAQEPADPLPGHEPVLTSVLFTLRSIPAALYKALGGFATNGLNMVKLESYLHSAKAGTAQFFLTFEGHPQERATQLALEELGFFSNKVHVLGVYPADPKRYLQK
ncbi:MAG: prephenate dehydratase [Rickettsiales bacterium]|nr:prephenate dehydratase [Rickettsiales bacterium]